MVAEVKIRNIEHTILINDVRVVKELNNDDFNVYDDFTNLVFLDTHYILLVVKFSVLMAQILNMFVFMLINL